MDENPKARLGGRRLKRIERLQAVAEDIRINELECKRTEALVTARAIALAGLPRKKAPVRELSRIIRLGHALWLRVTYQTDVGCILPYGEDRFVLAGIQHLALERRSPLVYFEQVSELLKMFDLSTDGRSLARLRERFKRLANLYIRLRFAETEQGLADASTGDSILMIKSFVLPTRKELRDELRAEPIRRHQLILPGFEGGEAPSRYGVLLSADFWEHLKQPKNHLIVRLDIMKEFVNRPIGWDYAMFLCFRCRWAQTESVVPHEALMAQFKDSLGESDNQTIRRLQGYHDEIMTATAGSLKAELRPAGYFPRSKKGGNIRQRWELWVEPSRPIVWSGKKDELSGAAAESGERTIALMTV
jgi:hypothetical protein